MTCATHVFSRKNKKVIVEGVAGSSTHTQDSAWFEVFGIEDDLEKAGVEAYVLKKITNDLPLEPILAALKWDHLTDLKLGDPDSGLQQVLICCYM